MFPKHPLGRRRWLRHSRGPAPAIGGREDGALAQLCRWGESQPWVVRTRGREGRGVRFLVDCPELSRREPWFALEVADEVLDGKPLVLVALPSGVGERGVALGWAQLVGTLPDGRTIVGVGPPGSPSGLRALQRLLELAYSACFDPTVSPEW